MHALEELGDELKSNACNTRLEVEVNNCAVTANNEERAYPTELDDLYYRDGVLTTEIDGMYAMRKISAKAEIVVSKARRRRVQHTELPHRVARRCESNSMAANNAIKARKRE